MVNTARVVITTLTRAGMPLIRYRTGDISRFIKEPCPCGTVLKTMEKIRYRRASAVRLESGTLLTMPELDEYLFQIDGITDFEAEVNMLDGTECLIISVKAPHDISKLEARIRDVLLQSGIKELILSGKLRIDIRKAADKAPDLKGGQEARDCGYEGGQFSLNLVFVTVFRDGRSFNLLEYLIKQAHGRKTRQLGDLLDGIV